MKQEAKIYRIAKWRSTFETADSRRHKVLTWVSVPNNLASNGYVELVSEFGDESPAIYGAWIAMVMIASTCACRGILCTSNAAPLTAARLSFLSHFPSTVFEKLLPWAESVGWLEILTSEQAKQLLTSQQTTDDQPANELPDQTRPDLTKPNPTTTTPDQTKAVPSVGRQSLSSNGLVLNWTHDDIVREGEKFRKSTKVMPSVVPTDMLAKLVGFGLSTANGFTQDVAASFRAGTVRVPGKYITGAIRKYCDEHGLVAADAVQLVEQRLLEVKPKKVEQNA